MSQREGNAITRVVGRNVAKRRGLAGYTQKELAEKISRTMQQVSKYETGVDQISSGLLYEIAQHLGCSVTDFYVGVGELLPPLRAPRQRHKEFMDDYHELTDDMRATVRELVRAIMKETAGRMKA